MATLEEQFKARISGFLDDTGMAPTTLGMLAVGDPEPAAPDRAGPLGVARDGGPGRGVHGPLRTETRAARVTPPRRPSGKTRRSGAETGRPADAGSEADDPFPAHLGGRGPDEPGAEHDLPLVGRGALPGPGPAPGAWRAGSRPRSRSGYESGWRAGARTPPATGNRTPRRRTNENERSDGRTKDERRSEPAGAVPPAARQVLARTGLSRSTIYVRLKPRGGFPGRSRWARGRWAGSSRRSRSGSASGSLEGRGGDAAAADATRTGGERE